VIASEGMESRMNRYVRIDWLAAGLGKAMASLVGLMMCITAVFGGSAVFAQERLEVQALQYSLKRLGFYSSTVDGLMGPGTRAAISAFANENDAEPNFDAVFMNIARRDLPWAGRWNDDAQEAVEATLKNGLIDYGSAQYSGRNMLYVSEGQKWVTACVEVNARNQLGGYTGYQWFFLKGFRMNIGTAEHYSFFMDDLTDYQALALCQLGYIQELSD